MSSVKDELWGRVEVLSWLLKAAVELQMTFSVSNHAVERNSRFNFSWWSEALVSYYERLASPQCPLRRYCDFDMDSFVSEIPRLPADVHPIDAPLQDPVLMQGGRQAQHFLQHFLQNAGEGNVIADVLFDRRRRRDGTGNEENRRFARNWTERVREFFHTAENRQLRPVGPPRANVNLNRPLLQLLIITFFPWIFVPATS
jgi:hypothetical protein